MWRIFCQYLLPVLHWLLAAAEFEIHKDHRKLFFLILGGAWTVLRRSVAVTLSLLLHRPSLEKSRRRMCYWAAFGVAIQAPGFDPMTRMLHQCWWVLEAYWRSCNPCFWIRNLEIHWFPMKIHRLHLHSWKADSEGSSTRSVPGETVGVDVVHMAICWCVSDFFKM